MAITRAFRFAAEGLSAPSWPEWADNARRLEDLGYSTLVFADHFNPKLATIPALTAAALATTSLRVGCTVFDNDFRHPALLAKEAATLDLLSNGRLEFGIGAGWKKDQDYDRTGIPFDPPGTRVGRLEEAVRLIKRLWTEESVTLAGHYYQVRELEIRPWPVQRPHPPIFIGAGGKRLLSFAAREADIVGVVAQAHPEGVLAIAQDTLELVREKVGWVREAAGERFDRIELAALIWEVVVTDNRRAGAEEAARRRGVTPEQVLASPYFLVGSLDKITEDLVALRELSGISYISVVDYDAEEFAPVVARLAGS